MDLLKACILNKGKIHLFMTNFTFEMEYLVKEFNEGKIDARDLLRMCEKINSQEDFKGIEEIIYFLDRP